MTMFRTTKKLQYLRYLLAVGAVVLLLLSGACSKSKPTTPPGGPGGGREFVSGDLQPGQSFSHTFNRAGVFPYYCRYHAGMAGTITVTAGGTADTRNVSITANSLPSLDLDVGDRVIWTNNHNMVHTVESTN